MPIKSFSTTFIHKTQGKTRNYLRLVSNVLSGVGPASTATPAHIISLFVIISCAFSVSKVQYVSAHTCKRKALLFVS